MAKMKAHRHLGRHKKRLPTDGVKSQRGLVAIAIKHDALVPVTRRVSLTTCNHLHKATTRLHVFVVGKQMEQRWEARRLPFFEKLRHPTV